MINASVLNYAGTGDNVLIVGFSILGSSPKRVLLRAVGPALAAYGKPDALADPHLDLYPYGGALIASNEDWGAGDVTPLRLAFQATGAFDLPSTTSKDAVLLITLAPGLYSAVVSGDGGTTGDALLEVYELP